MWGNTVNVASRMESTGRAGSIQVVEETATTLQHFGFDFEQRGLISVKGKGKLMTYYLIGKRQPKNQASSASSTLPPTQAAGSGASGGVGASMRAALYDTGSKMVESCSASVIKQASVNPGDSGNLTNGRNLIKQQQTNCSQESLTGQQQQHIASSTSLSQQSPSNTTDTTNKRMYITPAKRDFSNDADIHLV